MDRLIARLGTAAGLALALAVGAVAGAAATPLYDETDDPARRTAIDQAHQQMATCVAFFLISAEGVPPTAANRPALERLDRGAGALIDQMLRLRDESITRARVEAERQWLMLAIGGSLTGYPRLHEALADPCTAMAADPQGQLDRRLDGESPEAPPQE